MNKKIFIILLTGLLLVICGCSNDDNNKNVNSHDSKINANENVNYDEMKYLKAKEYYANKEYAHACHDFSSIRGYKDVDEILASDVYFKLCENEYEKIDTELGYLLNFSFETDINQLSIIYTTLNRVNYSESGAYKINNGYIYLEKDYASGNYEKTKWSIKKIKDDSIVVVLENKYSFTLYKK